MRPYMHIFPGDNEGIITFQLLKKTGRMPKGDYLFVEAYCTEKGCDCRRVTLFVINAKGKPFTAIDFGFDPDSPMSGPYIADFPDNRPLAEDLLEVFTSRINQDAAWLAGMYERYRKVRQHIDGKKYRGKKFPEPGAVIRVPQDPPDIPETLRGAPPKTASNRNTLGQGGLFDGLSSDPAASRNSMAEIVDQFARLRRRGFSDMDDNDIFVRTEILPDLKRYDELAALLPRIIPRNEREEERMQAALELLRSLFEMLRHEIEAGRPNARERLETMQSALAVHVFGEKGDINLAAHVTRILLDTRVEILPAIYQANQQRFYAMGGKNAPGPPSFKGPPLGSILRDAGCQSPFEGVHVLLDNMILLDANIQLALCRELLDSRDSFVRDTGALMVFHPVQEVREGVAALMAGGSVRAISPETFRRLIISRNWFPAAMRGQIDTAISSARRRNVPCAQLAPAADCLIKASTIDGAGAQSFFMTAGKGKRKIICNILWKQKHGVIDSFVARPNPQELTMLMSGLPENILFQEVSPVFLHQVVCHALAVGNEAGKPPYLGLLEVAEAIGCDKWRAELLNPAIELAAIRREMEGNAPHLLSKSEQRDALQYSADWPYGEEFADTWFEDDFTVDKIISNAQKGKKRVNHARLAELVANEILEPRRALWLERLVLMTRWLQNLAQAPVPWQQMFHLAEAVAGGKPLKDIPLMFSIAEISVEAALNRGFSEN